MSGKRSGHISVQPVRLAAPRGFRTRIFTVVCRALLQPRTARTLGTTPHIQKTKVFGISEAHEENVRGEHHGRNRMGARAWATPPPAQELQKNRA